jgi:hypothetical protein
VKTCGMGSAAARVSNPAGAGFMRERPRGEVNR